MRLFHQHATTKHELSLHHYYTSLLHSLRTAQSSQQLLDATTLSLLLQRLSTLIRLALRNVNGEEDYDNGQNREEWELLGAAAASIEGVEIGIGVSPMTENPSDMGSPSKSIAGLPSTARSSSVSSACTSQSVVPAGQPPRTPSSLGYDAWHGNMTPSGGYPGTFGRRDWALDREGEIIRLTAENKALREMLGVDEDVDIEALIASSQPTVTDKLVNNNAHAHDELVMVDVNLADESPTVQGFDVPDQTDKEADLELVEQSADHPSIIGTSHTVEIESEPESAPMAEQIEEMGDLFSTSPKQTLSRLSLKSPKLTKHHTYAGIPTTATTPLSPSAIRDSSVAARYSDMVAASNSDSPKRSHQSTSPPSLVTQSTSGQTAAPSSGGSHSTSSNLSTLLLRARSKTKTEPTTATSVGVDIEDDDTTGTSASYAAVAKGITKTDKEERAVDEKAKMRPASSGSQMVALEDLQNASAERLNSLMEKNESDSAIEDDEDDASGIPAEKGDCQKEQETPASNSETKINAEDEKVDDAVEESERK
jgi:hypothetical protein